jgi:hypothetical protein
MAVSFLTDAAKTLLKKFDAKIDQHEAKGKITTWERSEDGEYYTHTSAEWKKKAWMKPQIKSDRLVFNIIKPKSSAVTTTVYGYYHGHLIETFLNHFDTAFTEGKATAQATSDDLCGSS